MSLMSESGGDAKPLPTQPAPFSERTSTLVSLVLGSGAVLATAAWLQPAIEGHGTHQQLGLRPCTFLSITDYPCPMCGATTTFALMADLRILEALVNQPFAVGLFILTVGVFAISLAELIQRRARWTRILDRIALYECHLALGFLVFMGLAWVYKVGMMGTVG